jgi:cbb3-type cytochrome oxidase subunit 1
MTSAIDVSAKVPCVARLCFAMGSVAAVVGIALGLYTGINEDHTLTPVHAHFNLIGWVSMFLFGGYYRMHPQVVGGIAKIQVALVAIGYVMAFGALAVMLTRGDRALLAFTIAGSLMVFAGYILFCLLVCREALKSG